MNGRKSCIVRNLIRVAPEWDDEYLVGLRCQKEALFDSLYGRGKEPLLYGPSDVSLTEEDVDCMACCVARFS